MVVWRVVNLEVKVKTGIGDTLWISSSQRQSSRENTDIETQLPFETSMYWVTLAAASLCTVLVRHFKNYIENCLANSHKKIDLFWWLSRADPDPRPWTEHRPWSSELFSCFFKTLYILYMYVHIIRICAVKVTIVEQFSSIWCKFPFC